ncbi:MAG TPA: hypothetical protein VLS45_04630 [Methylomicrobium sp.]|nr:hypothetical protein [Methylomicrobium sp.]
MAKIKTYTKPDAIRTAVAAALMQIKADALENGKCPLREAVNGKNTGRKIPAWAQIERLAPECFRGPRSEQWIWQMMDSLGIVISGGTPQTGPLTATLAKEEAK